MTMSTPRALLFRIEACASAATQAVATTVDVVLRTATAAFVMAKTTVAALLRALFGGGASTTPPATSSTTGAATAATAAAASIATPTTGDDVTVAHTTATSTDPEPEAEAQTYAEAEALLLPSTPVESTTASINHAVLNKDDDDDAPLHLNPLDVLQASAEAVVLDLQTCERRLVSLCERTANDTSVAVLARAIVEYQLIQRHCDPIVYEISPTRALRAIISYRQTLDKVTRVLTARARACSQQLCADAPRGPVDDLELMGWTERATFVHVVLASDPSPAVRAQCTKELTIVRVNLQAWQHVETQSNKSLQMAASHLMQWCVAIQSRI